MPNSRSLNELDVLRHRLSQELEVGQAAHAVEWGSPRVMSEALKRIRHELGGEGDEKPTEDKLHAVLVRFAKSKSVLSFTDLKYLCYGATVPVGSDQWRVIDRQDLFDNLLDLVHRRTEQARQFRRCYQGLLTGYFSFERNLDDPGDADRRWVLLRGFLADQLKPLQQSCAGKGQMPAWLTILYEHRNLLTADPCSRYAKGLERGDESELHAVCAGLGIPSNSWVLVEAMMGYVKQVCLGSDAAFNERMQAVLDLVNGATSVTLPPALATMATAMIVTRYRNCAEYPEHPGLRDTCVQWIGNPWVKRVAWDAAVNHEPSRLMVNSWLKQRLIRDFFGLLAADGAADVRRLNYWLQWEPQITDMWFVLGGEAASNRGADFIELRKRMAGRDRRLQDTNQANNAFVMRIGPLLVIEFGLTGNACYIFAASDFKANLDVRMLSMHDLKQKLGVAARLSHAGWNWEGKFDVEIRNLLQRIPENRGTLVSTPGQLNATQAQSHPVYATPRDAVSPALSSAVPTPPTRVWPFHRIEPDDSDVGDSDASSGTDLSPSTDPAVRKASVPVLFKASLQKSSSDKHGPVLNQRLDGMELSQLQRLLSESGVEWEDNRSRGGALWVLITDERQHPGVTAVLRSCGFRFTAGRGYWLKDD